MSRSLVVHRSGPGLSVQDRGRTGWLSQGLSRGGAADALALAEGAVLLGQSRDCAALEMAGTGGTFEATETMRIALTGAPMRASIEGAPLAWGASHVLPAGQRLEIGPALAGVFGYLHVGGGFATPPVLGSRSAHVAAGIGVRPAPGTELPVGPDRAGAETGLRLPDGDRFQGGEVRVLPGPQTGFFASEEIARFAATTFRRDARGNRQGVALLGEGEGFHTTAGLSIVSEIVMPGDIQIIGDGTPVVLMTECQTTGGYPRIGTVLPCDLPRVAQAPPGSRLSLRFVDHPEALAAERAAAEALRTLSGRLERLVRDPRDIRDLLSYQLIGGMVAGTEEDPVVDDRR